MKYHFLIFYAFLLSGAFRSCMKTTLKNEVGIIDDILRLENQGSKALAKNSDDVYRELITGKNNSKQEISEPGKDVSLARQEPTAESRIKETIKDTLINMLVDYIENQKTRHLVLTEIKNNTQYLCSITGWILKVPLPPCQPRTCSTSYGTSARWALALSTSRSSLAVFYC